MEDTECFLVYDRYVHGDRSFYVLCCFRSKDRKLLYIRFLDYSDGSIAGNVYAARIEKKVKGVGIFLAIPDGHVFVRKKDCATPFYIRRQSLKKDLCEGDLVLVQVVRDAIKTKEPSGKLSVTIKTPYFVLEEPGSGTGLSKKLSSSDRDRFSSISSEGRSLVIRTAASGLNTSDLKTMISQAEEKIEKIFSDGANHTSPALVFKDDDLTNRILTAFPFAGNHLRISDIKTSDPDILKRLGIYGSLYHDEGLSLLDLYRISTITENLLKKTVWLKSGGNIVIEQTEALTVIDVNSAKTQRGGPFEINREAACTIMEEVRLRNLSGIIIIDFMKMSADSERKAIVSMMKNCADMDFAMVSIEGFTKLGLLEMTREKIFPSLSQTLTGQI